MSAAPFSWLVRFTVDPAWVADGFAITDDRALDMLASEVNCAHIGTELAAAVIEAPSPLQIVREQGYSRNDPASGPVIQALRNGTRRAGNVRTALIKARDLLDSVAFVSQPGDTEKVLRSLNLAIVELDARRDFIYEDDQPL